MNHFARTIQLDSATLLLRSHEHLVIAHDHPDWEVKFLNSTKPASTKPDADEAQFNKPISYRYAASSVKKTSRHPQPPALTKYAGVVDIEIDMRAKTVKIKVTSKLLEAPGQMLSKETFNHVWAAINATGLLRIDLDRIKDVQASAGLLCADVTVDLQMLALVASYVRILARYYTGKQYRPIPYGPNMLWQSVAACKRSKRSLTLYDKSREAQGDGFAPNTLRVELRLTSLQTLRKYLGIPAGEKNFLSLESALNSTANAVGMAFQEILGGMQADVARAIAVDAAPDADVDHGTLFLSGMDVRQEGIFLVLQRAGFDLDAIRARLRGDKNASRRLTAYKQVLTAWLAKESNGCQDLTLLRELADKILPAANLTQTIPTSPHAPA